MNADLLRRIYAGLAGTDPQAYAELLGYLGQTIPATPTSPAPRPGAMADMFPEWNKIPTVYTISIALDPGVGSSQGGSVQLRPEDFVLTRITWACTGDAFVDQGDYFSSGSRHGRCTEMTWSDEFTKFFGDTSGLISAMLGDSNGFLDLPYGIRFQGNQTLTLRLNRLFYPAPVEDEKVVRYDFCFHGLGLLPRMRQSSGTAVQNR